MRHTAHPAVERRPRIFVPGIAVSSADVDSVRVKIFDRLKGSRYFRRNRNASYRVRVLEQLLHRSRRRVLNELRSLRANLRF